MKQFLTTIVGPSGSGKTTLAEKLVRVKGYARVISTTTRDMRQGEVQGEHYHFVNRDEFLRRAEEREFVEHAEFAGNLYGISYVAIREALSAGGGYAVSINEIQGYRNLHRLFARTNSPIALTGIFLDVSPNELIRRLGERGCNTTMVDRIGLLQEERSHVAAQVRYDGDSMRKDRSVRVLHTPTWKQLDAFVALYQPSGLDSRAQP